MKISALIAEFNPFHRGHKLLIDSMKAQSDGVIAIMSGNFVQRGEGAVFEKSERAAARWVSEAELSRMIREGTFHNYGKDYFAEVFAAAKDMCYEFKG